MKDTCQNTSLIKFYTGTLLTHTFSNLHQTTAEPQTVI